MNLIEFLRWIIAVPLLMVWLYFSLVNFRILVRNIQTNLNMGPAPVTVVGGLAGVLGLLVLPYLDFVDRLQYAWVPLVLDLGSLPFYASMIVLAIWQGLNKKIWQNYFKGGRSKTE